MVSGLLGYRPTIDVLIGFGKCGQDFFVIKTFGKFELA